VRAITTVRSGNISSCWQKLKFNFNFEFWLLPQPVARRVYDLDVFFSVMTISKSHIKVSNKAVNDVAGSGCEQYEIYLPYMHITEGMEENHEFKSKRNRSPDKVDFT